MYRLQLSEGDAPAVLSIALAAAVVLTKLVAMITLRGFGGSVTECPMWAGTSVEAIKDLPEAGELVGRLWRESEAAGEGVDSENKIQKCSGTWS
jgi:hypothetical protein